MAGHRCLWCVVSLSQGIIPSATGTISLQGRKRSTVARPRGLDVQAGEFMVLVGPSGCGKSTTLRMIAGLEDISEGRLLIGGRDVTPRRAARARHRDGVPVVCALSAHDGCYMNMAFGLLRTSQLLRRRDRAARADEAAVAAATSPNCSRRKPNELSGGQRQRVAMGRALVRKPKVFLFDEPLSNLDAKLRTHMRGELEKLHAELRHHHRLRDARPGRGDDPGHPHRRDGPRAACGRWAPPMEVYRQPANRFVASFIGSPVDELPAGARRHDRGGGLAQQPTLRRGRAAARTPCLGLRPGRAHALQHRDHRPRRRGAAAAGPAWCSASSAWAPKPTPRSAWAPPMCSCAPTPGRAALTGRRQPIVLTPELARMRVFDAQHRRDARRIGDDRMSMTLCR